MLTGTDPGRAERIAQSITDVHLKATTLVLIADSLKLCGSGAI